MSPGSGPLGPPGGCQEATDVLFLAQKTHGREAFQLFSKQFLRDCPKSLVGARGVALWTTGKALFDPFRLPHVIRIHLRNGAQYLFGQSRKMNSRKFEYGECSEPPYPSKPILIRQP